MFLFYFLLPSHRKRFPPPSAGDEREPLGLDGHSRALDVLLNVPGNGRRKNNKTNVRFPRYFFMLDSPLHGFGQNAGKTSDKKPQGKCPRILAT
jgi:hypothetical protein